MSSVFPGGIDDFNAAAIDPLDMGATGHTTHLAWTQKASDALQKIETDLVTGHGGYPSLDGRLDAITSSVVTDHGALGGLGDDDHPQYQLRSEKGAANGYAGLGSGGRVPIAQIASGSYTGTQFVRGDGVLATPPTGGGSATPLAPAGQLSGAHFAGAASITIQGSPPAGLASPYTLTVGIGYPGSNFEARAITPAGGSDFDLNYPLLMNHADSDPLWILPHAEVNPGMYGAHFDNGAHDDWGAYCRMMVDGALAGVRPRGLGRGFINQPLAITPCDHKGLLIWAGEAGWSGPVQAPQIGAAFMGCKYVARFTATAADDHITILDNTIAAFQLDAAAETRVFFANPHGGSLPAGINANQIYWVKGHGPDYITVSASYSGGPGTQVNLTSDGSGIIFMLPYLSLAKHNFEDFRGECFVDKLSTMNICAQQKSHVTGLELYQWAGSSDGAVRPYTLDIGPAQGCIFEDVNTRSIAGSSDIHAFGASLMSFKGWTYLGHEDASPSMVFNACFAIQFDDLWWESFGTVEVQGGPCSALDFGNIHGAGDGDHSNWPSVKDTSSGDSSYRVRSFHAASGNAVFWRDDAGNEIRSWDGIGHGQGLSDVHQYAPGIVKFAGRNVVIADRLTFQTSTSSFYVNLLDELYELDCSASDVTMNVPVNVIFGDFRWRFKKVAGAHNVIITPVSPKTIDGLSTKTYTDAGTVMHEIGVYAGQLITLV